MFLNKEKSNSPVLSETPKRRITVKKSSNNFKFMRQKTQQDQSFGKYSQREKNLQVVDNLIQSCGEISEVLKRDY